MVVVQPGDAQLSGGDVLALTPDWLPIDGGPVLAWRTGPVRPSATTGVVIVAPLAYEQWTTHATLRELAWRLAEAGVMVLRFDSRGTGDSGGDSWQPLDLADRVAEVAAAAATLRSHGCERVLLVGLRFGASLALLAGAEVGADAIVAVAPVVRGSRLAKELTLLGSAVPDTDPRDWARGSLVSGGVPFPAETLAGVRGMDLRGLTAPPAPRVLLVAAEASGETDALAARLTELGSAVDRQAAVGLDGILGISAERAVVPAVLLAEITNWLSPGTAGEWAGAPRLGVDGAAVDLPWRGGRVREQPVVLGPSRLVGVLAEPADGGHPDTVVVFLNSGAEHHVGPGRAWVELARQLSLDGIASVRLDFAGWGESVLQAGSVAARPYAASGVTDAVAAAEALHARGFDRVLLVGLCSSAWVALRAAESPHVDGVYALNPQLYWQPGDPDQMNMAEGASWRAASIRREARGRRLHLWSLLDVVGVPTRARGRLSDLGRRGRPVRLVYADGDLGLTYVRDRLSRQLRRVLDEGIVELAVLPGIDHQMHLEWRRHVVATDLAGWVRGLQRAATPTEVDPCTC